MTEFDYKVIRSSRKTMAVQVKNGEVIVRVPYRTSNARISDFLRTHADWIKAQIQRQNAQRKSLSGIKELTEEELEDLKKKAGIIIPERVRIYAGKMGVSYGKISIRSQHTRWGSCSSKGNLNFNCLLLLGPLEVLDYVVVHELCHIREMNHSQRFYQEVQKFCPDYRKQERWLKEHGGELMARLP